MKLTPVNTSRDPSGAVGYLKHTFLNVIPESIEIVSLDLSDEEIAIGESI